MAFFNPNLSEDDKAAILREKEEEQEELIQRKYETGEIPEYSKNITNGNGKTDKKINTDREFIDSINKMLDDSEDDNNDNNNKKPKKRKITTFKYSQLGKGDLYESVFIDDGLPVIIKYNEESNSFEAI